MSVRVLIFFTWTD